MEQSQTILYPIPLQQQREEFKTDLREVINSELDKRLTDVQQKRYYSADKICELLDITKPTLHEWRKRGIIRSFKLGSRVYYRWDEVENAMTIND